MGGLAFVCWQTWAEPPRFVSPPKPKPDLANVRYGPHDRNVLDFWKARPRPGTTGKTPLVVFFHGGGFRLGDKSSVPGWLIAKCLDSGDLGRIRELPAIGYGHVPRPMLDGARAIQYLRSRADELGIDPSRMAASGSSAGAGIAVWIGFHDDLAFPRSSDPVARQLTRLACIGASTAPRRRTTRGSSSRLSAVARMSTVVAQVVLRTVRFRTRFAPGHKLYEEASPINHATSCDPPVILFYAEPDEPLSADAKPGRGNPSPPFRAALKAKLDAIGVECVVRHSKDFPEQDDPRDREYREMTEFFRNHFMK